MKSQGLDRSSKFDRLRHAIDVMTGGRGNRFAFSELLPDFPNSRTSPFPGRTLGDTTIPLQGRIIESCGSETDVCEARTRLDRAAEESLIVMLQMILGRRATESIYKSDLSDFVDLAFWGFVRLHKKHSLSVPLVRRVIADKLNGNDASFFMKFGKELSKPATVQNVMEFNPIAFRMAQYWVHSDCPLWMMNNEAGSRFVGHLLGTNVSAENYAQIIKRYDLIRFGSFPIRGTKIDKDGKFMGFEFSRSAKIKITGTRLDRHNRFVGFDFGRWTKAKV